MHSAGDRVGTLLSTAAQQVDHAREAVERKVTQPRPAEGPNAIDPRSLAHPGHRHHAFFESNLRLVLQAEKERGIAPGAHSARLAGAITVSCLQSGVSHIDRVQFNDKGTFARGVQSHPELVSAPVATAEGSRRSLITSGEQALQAGKASHAQAAQVEHARQPEQEAHRSHARAAHR